MPVSDTYRENLVDNVPFCDTDREKAIELESNVTVSGSYHGWVDINVTAAAAQWNFFPVTNHGLYMIVKDAHGKWYLPGDFWTKID